MFSYEMTRQVRTIQPSITPILGIGQILPEPSYILYATGAYGS